MKTLVLGGTRFVGKALVSNLLEKGYDLTLFTRGQKSVPSNVKHIKGDRNSDDIQKLKGMHFDLIIDTSGRTMQQTKRVIEVTGEPLHRFVYISSAGVYADNEQLPFDEESNIDKNSRHIGKADTESWLRSAKIGYTSFRPTYIYGAGNYNPIEKWFFDRILYERPIPIPFQGNTITQLGHVSDLSEAIYLSIENDKARNSIYNCSGKKGITFKGLVYASAIACGKDPKDIQFAEFDPTGLDKKERKVFPLRLNHFLTDISHIQREINWTPKIKLEDGLLDSFRNDYSLNQNTKPDFSLDINLLGY